jgi:hypothetical protein
MMAEGGSKKKLSSVYQHNQPIDTTLSNGAYLLHFVNQDTTDTALYVKYGNRNLGRLYVI